MFDPTRHVCFEDGCHRLAESGDTLCRKHRRVLNMEEFSVHRIRQLVNQGTHTLVIKPPLEGKRTTISYLMPIVQEGQGNETQKGHQEV